MKATVTEITTTNGEFYALSRIEPVVAGLKCNQWLSFAELVKHRIPHSEFHNLFFETKFKQGNKVAVNVSRVVSVRELSEVELEMEDEDDEN